VKAVARTLRVARSNLTERLSPVPSADSQPSGSGPTEAPVGAGKDASLLVRVQELVGERPSYGYRRVTAMLNRQHGTEGRLNHKRVYRVMREHKLLLERGSGRPQRIHDGTIITLKSNLRWCSDTFEVWCWSGERVRVAFSLDCCDREAISYVATTGFITGEMIRDLMVDSIEARFGVDARRVPHAIEWLSDNGSVYTANDTVDFASSLGFLVCTTPPYCPESNGMAEAFVKSFKRDYVYLNDRHTGAEVIAKIPAWLADYNQVRPHKGLNMLSPSEYRTINHAA
jgi:transposase InsO family protein